MNIRMTPLPPGSNIGIIGGGQLGRMLGVAAAQLGYRTHVYAPEQSGPAADTCAQWTQGAYEDSQRLGDFADAVDVLTYEFENIDSGAIETLSHHGSCGPMSRRCGSRRTASRKRASCAIWAG
jgi:5-(carboxyamino)imidazole ribonucleotide synthase